MKAFIKLNLTVDFPGDPFHSSDEIISMIDQYLRDHLFAGVDYSGKTDDFFYVDQLELTEVKPITY